MTRALPWLFRRANRLPEAERGDDARQRSPQARMFGRPTALALAGLATAALLAACGSGAAPASPTTSAAISAAPSSAAAGSGGGAYAAPAGGSAAASSSSAPSGAASTAPASASAAGSASAQASAAAAPVVMVTSVAVSSSGSLGKFLVDGRGHSLYTFAKDQKNVSNCSGGCAVAWPPAEASSVPALPAGTPGTLALIARAPGGQQLTYNGAPLYFFKADVAAGSTKGNGVGGVWHLATVAAS
ncbi:MAG TPA: hypothetical protein VMV93_10195 [Chloroflexota bacterium]|nr:hypothetical protein [Chloroflexota bacterium]